MPVNSINTGTITAGKLPYDWVKPRWRPIECFLVGRKNTRVFRVGFVGAEK
jgi:hypothetical protein